jgi:anthranilate/para-aminobenzoate synthase component II
MVRLGIINLGVGEEYLDKVLLSLEETINRNYWSKEMPVFDYKRINHTEIAESCDALVLSPGTALVGLLDYERAEMDPHLGPLYNLIHLAVKGGIPLIGVNAGHEALNCAYGWAIGEVPDKIKKEYQKKQEINLSQIRDPLLAGIEKIAMQLSNNFAVLPKEGQRKRFGQENIEQLAFHFGYPLISAVKSKEGVPVYGVQFNIQSGTKKVFENFFKLAQKYIAGKE